ncbi:MAG: hypothetical protein AB7O43_17735 [Hyphomicrobiaceae bacterium]
MAEPLRSWRQRRGSEVRHEHTRELVREERLPADYDATVTALVEALRDLQQRMAFVEDHAIVDVKIRDVIGGRG